MSALVVVGACYIDTILTVPYYPKEDEKLRAASLAKRRGGNGPNSLQVLQQLIGRHSEGSAPSLALCSVLPSKGSADIKLIESSLGSCVDLSTCIYREGHSAAASSYVIRSTATASRTIVNYNQLPEMTLAEFQHACTKVDSPKAWYHFEGRIPDISLQCITHLRQQHPGVTISVELEKPGRAGLEELASEADVVFYSQSWAKSKNYESARECLQAQSSVAVKATLLFCTWGERGSAALEQATGRVFESPAFKPPGKQLVDSTGAGDAFIAAILFVLTSKNAHSNSNTSIVETSGKTSISDLLQFANEIAGRKVFQEGFDDLGQYGHIYFDQT